MISLLTSEGSGTKTPHKYAEKHQKLIEYLSKPKAVFKIVTSGWIVKVRNVDLDANRISYDVYGQNGQPLSSNHTNLTTTLEAFDDGRFKVC